MVVNQASAWNQPTDYHFGDCEHDDSDDEPSLGSKNQTEFGTQAPWCSGDNTDLEDQHDGAEGDELEDNNDSGIADRDALELILGQVHAGAGEPFALKVCRACAGAILCVQPAS